MTAFLDEVEAAVPALRRYARALTRNADRADDLVQDCLERAIRKQRLFRPTGPVEAWLFRMLLNLFRNQRRSERRQAPAMALDAIPFEPVSPPAQPGRIALAEMSRAIDALSTSPPCAQTGAANAATAKTPSNAFVDNRMIPHPDLFSPR